MDTRDDRKREDGGQPTSVTRRTFVGLALGAVGILASACGGEAANPTGTAAPTSVVDQPPTGTLSTASLTPRPTLEVATVGPTPSTVAATESPLAVDTIAPSVPTSTHLPPTYTPVSPTSTTPPTLTATTEATKEAALNRGDLLAHWPTTSTSRVVTVHHSGVYDGDRVNPDIVTEMLSAGLSALTDSPDVLAVWKTLFAPGDRVLLKVNCIAAGGPTQPEVTYAVTQRLQDAGLSPENILIFDRRDDELEAAGYSLNGEGPGVRCHGTRGSGSQVALSQANIRFYQEFDDCDAIINLPIPKQHGMAGISVALKNHYGSVDRPSALHDNSCDPAIAELNDQPNIRDKTRLVIGSALKLSPGVWDRPERGNVLLFSFDPVALDTVARDLLIQHREAQGLNSGFVVDASLHLRTAQSLNLGATDAALIDLHQVSLG